MRVPLALTKRINTRNFSQIKSNLSEPLIPKSENKHPAPALSPSSPLMPLLDPQVRPLYQGPLPQGMVTTPKVLAPGLHPQFFLSPSPCSTPTYLSHAHFSGRHMEFQRLRGVEARPSADTVRPSMLTPAVPLFPLLPSATLTLSWSHRFAYRPLETAGAPAPGPPPLPWAGRGAVG